MKKWILLIAMLTCGMTACQAAKTPNPNQAIPAATDDSKQFSSSTLNDISLLYSLTAHQGRVLDVAFSPSGDLLASSGQDKKIRIWDTNSGEEIRSFPMAVVDMADIDISPNGEFLASGETIWDLNSGEEVVIVERGSQIPAFIAFSPDGRNLAVARFDQGVEIWDVPSGEINKTLELGEEHRTKRMEYSPDGSTLAAGVIDGTIRFWDVESGEILQSFHFSGETDIHDMAYSTDGKYIAATGRLLKAVVWDTNNGEVVKTFPMTDNGLGITFSHDSSMIVLSGGGEEALLIYKIPSGERLGILPLPDQAMAVSFSPNGKYLAAGCFNGQLLIWRISPD